MRCRSGSPAGVDPRRLDVQATPDTLLIKAEIEHAHSAAKGTIHVCEFQPGHLFRAVRLPVKVDPDAVKAEYRNGLLRVTAAVASEQQARNVQVHAA